MEPKTTTELSPTPPFPAAEVRAALRDILHSEAFATSKRSCDFLSYVVEQTLRGVQNELKERTIAVAVFGRIPSYDSHEDAIVRIAASEVRKRLGYYYAGSGKETAVRISLPKGGYVPAFDRFEGLGMKGTDLLDVRCAGDSRPGMQITAGVVRNEAGIRNHRTVLLGSFLGALIIAFVAISWFHSGSPAQTFLDQFWAPALHASEPVYLVAAAAPVFVAYTAGETLPPNLHTEYVATNDQYVGQGDMLASHLLATMLQRMHQSYEVKTSSSVDVRDLPRHTVVLIGYSSTQWESISKELRYYIDGERAGMITDHGHDTEWYPRHLTKDLHADEDYAIISRFLDPATRAMVVLVSGATQYGTEGAAMLVTDPDLLKNALRDRPAGWETKNLQVVLHMKVIANTPATPEVVATYYW
jgi:hypothetical protein